jgi:(p)ppGpp synthase/HD superfamily hydrolase
MLVKKAIYFAAEKHEGQRRKGSDLPYIVHPMTVMYLITKYKGTSKNVENLQCAALCHDLLEDTECSYLELEREFNPMVASLVMELTSDNEMIKEMGKNQYLMQKMVNMSKYAFVLKLIDRLANVSDKPKKKYLRDTINMIHYLHDNREDLTSRQVDIMEEIQIICLNGLDEEGLDYI